MNYPTEENLTLIKDSNVQPPFNINATIPYTCNSGYILSDSTFVVQKKRPVFTCKLFNNSAVWQIDSTCKPVSCGDPGYVENAKRKGLEFSFSKKVKFECDNGYRMKENINFRYCDANGNWIPSLDRIKCQFVGGCTSLDVLPNGFITYTDNQTIGSEAHYSCEKGYKLFGNPIRQCSKNATWTGSAPECKKISCLQPGPFPNGLISPKQKIYFFKDMIIYHCPITNQSSTAICTEKGTWSNAPPLCEIKKPLLQKSNQQQHSFKHPVKEAKKRDLQNSIFCSIIIILIAIIITFWAFQTHAQK